MAKFEVVRWEIARLRYSDFLAVRTSVVEWAVEWAVKKPLGRVQKATDYPWFLCLVMLAVAVPCWPV